MLDTHNYLIQQQPFLQLENHNLIQNMNLIPGNLDDIKSFSLFSENFLDVITYNYQTIGVENED